MSRAGREERLRAALAWLDEWNAIAPKDMMSLTKEEEDELLGYAEMTTSEPSSVRPFWDIRPENREQSEQ